MANCCPDEACQEEPELWNDPTLADCCRRDLQEQHYVARVKGQLLAVDRTEERQKAKAEVLRTEAGWASDDSKSAASSDEGAHECMPMRPRTQEGWLVIRRQAHRPAC